MDRLAGVLGRGAWLAAVRDPAGALVPVLGLVTEGSAEEPLEQLLTDALESVPEDSVEELPGGSLSCPWGDDGPLCVAVCPTRLVLVPRDVALAAGPAVCAPAAVVSQGPVLALSLRSGDAAAAPTLKAVLPASSAGGLAGAWTVGGASP
jgi:hypothetical protein